MQLPWYRVHAFTDRPEGGNPAAVHPLSEWLPGPVMQGLAREHGLSETAFFVPRGPAYELRWFTPTTEVDLCGHATLAAAWVILERLQPTRARVSFQTRSGPLAVTRQEGGYLLDLPARPGTVAPVDEQLVRALGVRPLELRVARNWLAVLEDEEQVRQLRPDLDLLAALPCAGLGVTAPGREVDFVSRYFAPREGIDEDPVTGSFHCTLVPYWAARLGQASFSARQLSARGGELACTLRGKRVGVAGAVYLFAEGTVHLRD